MSTLFTMVDRPMVAIRNYGYRFAGIPIHPDPTHIRTAEQGDAVARMLGKSACCLLRGHGSVAAQSIPHAVLDSLEMEENARSAVHAASLGIPQADHPRRGRTSQRQLLKERLPHRQSVGPLPAKGGFGRLAGCPNSIVNYQLIVRDRRPSLNSPISDPPAPRPEPTLKETQNESLQIDDRDNGL
jgi:hypothetical protein